jgi:hypothetical protein
LLGPRWALAHKSSDAYLQIESTPQGTSVRWDIALRDLDAAVDLDANEDGRLTWAEVRAAWPRIEAYALPRFAIDGCTLRSTGRALERRNDGAYAVLQLASDCKLSASPVLHYNLFREIDPTHRGLARLQGPKQPLALLMLDPTQSAPASTAEAQPSKNAGSFVAEGVRHILTGYDHVLFLLCLLLPSVMRSSPQGWRAVDRLPEAVWPIVGIVSAFTVAHSITLGLAASGWVSLSPRFIEPAIAVTIILAAIDNIWPIFPVPRIVVAFSFGLIHGFGFAGVLSELQLPTDRFIWALLQFNLGLEVGQLCVVLSATSLLFLLRNRLPYRAWIVLGGSVAAMLISGVWLVERTANVSLLPI